MKKNKVFLRLYANLNLGDDLFLKILLDRYPNSIFYLEANDIYSTLFAGMDNLIVVKKKGRFLKKLKKLFVKVFFSRKYKSVLQKYFLSIYKEYFEIVDLFLSLGGSIFKQPRDIKINGSVVLYDLMNEMHPNKPKFFLGCNFGPYQNEAYKESYERIFSCASDVCFRESYSKKLFEEIDTVRYEPDIIFGMNVEEFVKEERSVGFSIVSPRGNISAEKYIKKYAELISFFMEKKYKIKLFSFCKNEGDEKTINQILKCLEKKEQISTVFYNGDIEDFLREYATVEKMFCGRFHSMILSMIYNQKIYPVIYSDKMTNVLADIHYKGEVIYMKDFANIDIEHVYSSINNNLYDVEIQRQDAFNHFKHLDTYLS